MSSLGCCAVVLFCFLWRRCLDLLPPHKFLQFIGEHQECFRIMEDKLLLKQDFNNCMAKMEDILDLIMVPFMIGQLWTETFDKIRKLTYTFWVFPKKKQSFPLRPMNEYLIVLFNIPPKPHI